MTPGQAQLLASYADGPRIWDAASIVPDVYALADQGLIEPHPDPDRPGVYQLTATGRQALAPCTVPGNHGPHGACPGLLFPHVPGSLHDDREFPDG